MHRAEGALYCARLKLMALSDASRYCPRRRRHGADLGGTEGGEVGARVDEGDRVGRRQRHAVQRVVLRHAEVELVVGGIELVDVLAGEETDLRRRQRAEIGARAGERDGVGRRQHHGAERVELREAEAEDVVAGIATVDAARGQRADLAGGERSDPPHPYP